MNTTTIHNTVTVWEATREGFVPVTTPYTRDERHLLERALVHLVNVSHKLVKTRVGIEIWRKQEEVVK